MAAEYENFLERISVTINTYNKYEYNHARARK